ncbi:NUDIX domain-containing protein [Ampelomyces quisqualis]|uniref:NUDIX domain-containing protein n=1 Tax=Ampelomyces quisqualis TaxID=50730 RepID=A0A6A5QAG6_AMPQU|nr:NUDIX domain-containing protein [Ampelomyces quisqualis]
MAASHFSTQQYPSSQFVESCGAILFDLSSPSSARVCLGNILAKDEWVLVKGRRNMNESRKDAAIRELYEETGYRGKLLPVRLATRVTVEGDAADAPDKTRVHEGLTEPFMCTVREVPSGNGVKIIWWFIAVLEDGSAERGPGEATFRSEFFGCEEAVEKLYFETDREVLRRAISIINDTAAHEA